MAVIMLGVILPDISKTDFNLHDFIRGLFAGMGSVTFAVWIVYLFKNSGKRYNADGSILLRRDKNIILAVTMMLLLVASVAADYFVRNVFVSAACALTVAASYILNLIYVKKKANKYCEG